jgi:hypothetical protein
MTVTTFDTALEAARVAQLQFAEHTRQFKLTQAKMAEEREIINVTAIEAAQTLEQVKNVLRHCPKHSNARDEAGVKLVSFAENFGDLYYISQVLGGSFGKKYADAFIAKKEAFKAQGMEDKHWRWGWTS